MDMNVNDVKIGSRVEIVQEQWTKDGNQEFSYNVEVTDVTDDAILGDYTPASVNLLLPGLWRKADIISVESLTKGTVV